MERRREINEEDSVVNEPLLLSSSIFTNYTSSIGDIDIVSGLEYNNFEMDPIKPQQSKPKYSHLNATKNRKLQFWEYRCWSSYWERSRWLTICYLICAFILFLCMRYVITAYFSKSQTLPSSGMPQNSKQINHYAIVIDAGSSGSRAYLYAWPSHSGNMHELLKIRPLVFKNKPSDNKEKTATPSYLEEPLVKKVTPGLSSFGLQLDSMDYKVMDYIRPLLEFASTHIPEQYHKETPLYILATAGMRLLSKPKQDLILSSLRKGIISEYPFLFPEGNLEIISGRQEGIYQWLAINYVLGKLDYQLQMSKVRPTAQDKESKSGVTQMVRPKTVGAIDMGGASMQIAMELPQMEKFDSISDQYKSQVVDINIGCRGDHDTEHSYRLFVTTFLGYGANEAFARHQRYLLLSQINGIISGESKEICGLVRDKRCNDPCLSLGMENDGFVNLDTNKLSSRDMAVYMDRNLSFHSGLEESFYTAGTGSWEKCFDTVKEFIKESEPYFEKCKTQEHSDGNCADNGIHLPSILHLKNKEFYGFSEFWYTMEDVLGLGGIFHDDKFKESATNFCKTNWETTWKNFDEGQFLKADKERIETQCFKSAWIAAVIKEGLLFPSDYSGLTSAPNTVSGRVAHWTVGALLYRTRYFPLRDIEAKQKSQLHYGIYHPPWASGYLYSHYIVFLCLALVLIAIFLYLRRLRRYVTPSSSFLNVPHQIRNLLPSSTILKNFRNSSNSNEGRYPLIAV